MNHTLAHEIASTLQAFKSCRDRSPSEAHLEEWERNHYARLKMLCQNGLPHGAGIDSTHPEELHGLSVDQSTDSRIVVHVEFHHMDDVGSYDGWTDHRIVITPAFTGLNVTVSGRNRNGIKDYLAEAYQCALSEIVDRETGIPVRILEHHAKGGKE